ncbi:MAG: flagellar hook-basal body complex protein [Pseudomonadota bacterium]
MSVFGSIFTGVSGLNAQSQSLTVISNNIANNQTPGFKRAIASFANLVTGSDTNSILQPGGVRAGTLGTQNLQGLLQSTGREEDLAILGDGLFVVGQNENNQIQFPFYTRAGRFEENERGFLQTPAELGSQILYGWRLDENGDIPTNFDNVSSLEPVNLNFLPGFNQQTTTIDPAINLNAAQPLSGVNNPTGNTFESDFTRIITVFDSLGEPQEITLELAKSLPPNRGNYISDLSDLTLETELNPGGAALGPPDVTLAIDIDGTVSTVTIDGATTSLTVGELIDRINAALPDGTAAGAGSATLSDTGQLVIVATNEAGGATVNSVTSAGAGATTLFALVDTGLDGPGATAAANLNAPIQAVYDETVAAGTLNPANAVGTFPPLASTSAAANEFGWWQVRISAGDQVNDSGSIGYINFNADGSINHRANANGNIAISLSGINFNNGSSAQAIEFGLDRLTQLNSQFLTTDIDQNGSSFGVRRDFNIDNEGVVNVVFSNDEIVPLYKIAIADFPNVNGLNQESLNVLTSSNESGEVILREANLNGSGAVFSGSFEQSNVDLADEFSRLIITQRAYSANTKVINTADQMLAELLNIR